MDLAREILAVLLVFALLGGVLWVLRRSGAAAWRMPGRRAQPGRIELAGRLPLSPQHTLHLVRLGGRALLIASHAGGCTLLESMSWRDCQTMPPPEEPR
jgi:flagellar biogenesis protein FliO